MLEPGFNDDGDSLLSPPSLSAKVPFSAGNEHGRIERAVSPLTAVSVDWSNNKESPVCGRTRKGDKTNL